MAKKFHLITYLKPIFFWWLENILNVCILSILDPPGPPEISGYIEGETIRLGQTITLVCTAQGGNPLAEIIWYKNGIKVDSSYTTSGRASSNTYSFVATMFKTKIGKDMWIACSSIWNLELGLLLQFHRF